LADKIMTDTYQAARDYLRSFNLIAKNGWGSNNEWQS
jgi:hypothetical protein